MRADRLALLAEERTKAREAEQEAARLAQENQPEVVEEPIQPAESPAPQPQPVVDPSLQLLLNSVASKIVTKEPLTEVEKIVSRHMLQQVTEATPTATVVSNQETQRKERKRPKSDAPSPNMKSHILKYETDLRNWAEINSLDEEDIPPYAYQRLEQHVQRHVLSMKGTNRKLSEVPFRDFLSWIKAFLPPVESDFEIRRDIQKLQDQKGKELHKKFLEFDQLFARLEDPMDDATKRNHYLNAILNDSKGLWQKCVVDKNGDVYKDYNQFRENAYNQVRMRDSLEHMQPSGNRAPHPSTGQAGPSGHRDFSPKGRKRDEHPSGSQTGPKKTKGSNPSGVGSSGGPPLGRAKVVGIDKEYQEKVRELHGNVCLYCFKRGHKIKECWQLVGKTGEVPAKPIPPKPEGSSRGKPTNSGKPKDRKK